MPSRCFSSVRYCASVVTPNVLFPTVLPVVFMSGQADPFVAARQLCICNSQATW